MWRKPVSKQIDDIIEKPKNKLWQSGKQKVFERRPREATIT